MLPHRFTSLLVYNGDVIVHEIPYFEIGFFFINAIAKMRNPGHTSGDYCFKNPHYCCRQEKKVYYCCMACVVILLDRKCQDRLKEEKLRSVKIAD